MEGDLRKCPACEGLEYALANFETALRTATTGVGTLLSANLKNVAILADADYLYRNLSALADRWQKRPPYVGEDWTETDFRGWGRKLGDVWQCTKKLMAETPAAPAAFHLAVPAPGEEEKWRVWYLEEKYDRSEGKDKDLDADGYGQYLQPTSPANQWFFLEDTLRELAGFAPKGARSVFRSLSAGGCEWLMPVMDLALQRLFMLLDRLEMYRTGLCQGTECEEQAEGQMKHFCEEIYQDYVKVHQESLRAECAKWGAAYTARFKSTVVSNKMKDEFLKLKESGFLAPLLADSGCPDADTEKAGQVFRSAFFDTRGVVQHSLVGRYIYTHQFRTPDWRTMTEAFFRFLLLETLTGSAVQPVGVEEDAPFPPGKYDKIFHDNLDLAKVKVGLGDILTMKASDKEQLFRFQKLWYVVHRMFCEMHWIEKANEPAKFRAWAEDVFGALGKCSKSDYDAARREFKDIDLLHWAGQTKKDLSYPETAQAMWWKFMGKDGEREALYLKPGRRPVYKPNQRITL